MTLLDKQANTSRRGYPGRGAHVFQKNNTSLPEGTIRSRFNEYKLRFRGEQRVRLSLSHAYKV